MGRHDHLFKELFEAFFGDLLSLVVPHHRSKLVPEAAQFLRGEMFIDAPRGAKREVDLLARVPAREGRAPRYVLVHVEVEARARRSMAKRLWRYAMMQDSEKYLLAYTVENYLQLDEDDRKEYREMLAEIDERELPEVESWADYQAKLKREGRQEGVRGSILAVLEGRFGKVPTAVRRRVEAVSSLEELDRWLSLAATVDSLGELDGHDD